MNHVVALDLTRTDRRRHASATLGLLTGLVACASPNVHPVAPPPAASASPAPSVCPRAGGPDGGVLHVNNARADDWFALLVPSYSRSTHRVGDDARDCAGGPVTWRIAATDGATEDAPRDLLAPADVTEDDVIVGRGPAGTRIVWAIARRTASGDGIGPVAIVRDGTRGVTVEAIGPLRVAATHVRMRIESVGSARVLAAEGETCATDDPATCERVMRIVPLRENRFVPTMLRVDAGGDVGPALLALSRTRALPLPNRWMRQFDLASTARFTDDGIVVHEQVLVTDRDPASAVLPAQPFRRSESDRTIRVADGRLAVDTPSLWLRTLERLGSVQPAAESSTSAPTSH